MRSCASACAPCREARDLGVADTPIRKVLKPKGPSAPKARAKASGAKFEFEPIGFVETCFKEKFGIPRQSGLAREAKGILKLSSDPDFKTALRTLEGFSHLWIVFVFHEHGSKKWKPSIRPPRLGGIRKVGVLASRSPHRPNPIGLSAVELERIDWDAPGGPELHLLGVDILDGTPVLDIKPYLPYADSIPEARAGWADEPIVRAEVFFTEAALAAIDERSSGGYANLKQLIAELLSLDPRPSFQKRRMPPGRPEAEGTRYGFNIFHFDVSWRISGGAFWVDDVITLDPNLTALPKPAGSADS